MKNLQIDKDTVFDLYVTKELSTRDVAKILHIGQTSVRRLLERYGIPARSQAQSMKTPSFLEKRQRDAERYAVEYVKPTTNICPQCGNEFTVYSENRHKMFCSKECLSQALRAKRKKQYCKNCGREIIDYAYTRRYCDACIAEKGHIWVKPDRIETQCAYCGKPMAVIKSVYESNTNCYCSMECMGKHYSQIYSGENSPSWKGGKSHHYIGGFWTVRKLVRKRDNYTCQRCGINEDEYGKQMSVHHIVNYREFEDKEEANNPNNLICLCEPCHRFIHSNANTEHLFIQTRRQDKI